MINKNNNLNTFVNGIIFLLAHKIRWTFLYKFCKQIRITILMKNLKKTMRSRLRAAVEYNLIDETPLLP